MHRSLIALAALAALLLLPGCYVGYSDGYSSGYVGVPGPIVHPVVAPAPVIVHRPVYHHRPHWRVRRYGHGCYR